MLAPVAERPSGALVCAARLPRISLMPCSTRILHQGTCMKMQNTRRPHRQDPALPSMYSLAPLAPAPPSHMKLAAIHVDFCLLAGGCHGVVLVRRFSTPLNGAGGLNPGHARKGSSCAGKAMKRAPIPPPPAVVGGMLSKDEQAGPKMPTSVHTSASQGSAARPLSQPPVLRYATAIDGADKVGISRSNVVCAWPDDPRVYSYADQNWNANGLNAATLGSL